MNSAIKAIKGIKISPVNISERKSWDIRSGDTVRVWLKIQEKEKTRLQSFEGLVLGRKHGNEAGGTFTLRKVASGVGTERIFPIFSPSIDKVEVLKRAKVRRAKLYHIRKKATKEISQEMRKIRMAKDEPVSGADSAQPSAPAPVEKEEAAK